MSENSIPDGWKDGVLADIAEINPSVNVAVLENDDPVSFLSMADVGENGRILTPQVRSLKDVRSGFTRFIEKDVLFAKITPCMENGKGAFATNLVNGHGFGSTEFHVLRANDRGDAEFIYHVTQYSGLRSNAESYFSGSAGQQRVSSDFFAAYSMLSPPLPEQRKIARILTTVDNLIEKTEALIEKQKSIKQGMMHDLFTRGVDAGGKLRPPYEQAPHLYKQSSLGWIPKEWEVDHLVNRISLPQGQVDPKISPYLDWVLVAPDHIEQRTGRLIANETASQQNAISGKYVFECGDVVYSKIRPYLRKAILATQKGICSADMYPLHPCSTLKPRYLLALILGEEFSRFSESVSERSGFPKLNRSELAEFRTAFPTLPEQDRICHILITADKTLGTEESTLKVLRSIKTGLMQDLLTGKVRVNVSEAEEVMANV